MSTPVFTVPCLLFNKNKGGRDCGTINGHDESLSIRALMKDMLDETCGIGIMLPIYKKT